MNYLVFGFGQDALNGAGSYTCSLIPFAALLAYIFPSRLSLQSA